MNIDKSKVVHAARQGIPLVVKTHTLPHQTEMDLEEILGAFLEELGQATLTDRLAYCLRELTGNAKKANTKRVYFLDKGWDLNDPEVYEKGMRSFKNDTLDNIRHYLDLQEKHDLSIRVTFLIRNQVFHLSVRNNTPILPDELQRAKDRASRAWDHSDDDEALVDLLDDEEGAGLGIGILVLMLRKMGLTEKAFRLEATDNETVATLTVPMDKVRLERVLLLSDKFASVIDSLPPFPENLRNLLLLLEDPEVDFKLVARQLARDPAMTADLIKFMNSARNRGYERFESLQEAIRVVGIQGLKDLMYPYGAHRLLDKYIAKQRHLWDNATLVSLYASEIARMGELAWTDHGRAQIAGLLYNLGQIILTFLHPDLSAKILRFCRTKGFSADLFDELTQSINPAELGARIAEKWKFPADLVQILRHQNEPHAASETLQGVTAAVHLAASLRSVELDLLQYGNIHEESLKGLKLTKRVDLKALHDEVRRSVQP